MRRFGLAGAVTAVAWSLCGCGITSPTTGPSDASLDGTGDEADAPAADAPLVDGGVDAPPDGPPLMTEACDNAQLLSGCVAGTCTVTATGSPLPAGATLTVTQEPAPLDLNGDTLGSVLCSIALPAGVASVANLSLTIALSAPPDANATLFQRISSSLSQLVPTSQALGTSVVGLVTAPGDFGATERPILWSLQEDLGINVSSSANQASLLKNLSSQATGTAFYDGAHTFVCNGARLLMYTGLPANPGVRPAFVLGQPDLDTVATQTTASLFGTAGCSGVWSDGTRLVVASGNRILIWNAMPTESAAPADLVLGQPDFSSNVANNGGTSAQSLSTVVSVDSDGTRLSAAEVRNNRVLVWNTFPTTVDQPADVVVGQPDFTTSAANAGATPIYQAWGSVFSGQGLFVSGQFSPGLVHVTSLTANNPPFDFTALPDAIKLLPLNTLLAAGRVAVTPGGGLAVRDASSQRIAMLKKIPTASASIDFVLGQPDATRIVSSPVSASVVSTAGGDEGLGGGASVLVPNANRLLVFDTPPSYTFEPASRVIGQAGFTTSGATDYGGISASTLADPSDVAVSPAWVAVADRGNNRVVLYRSADLAANNPAGAVVLGQPDAASYVPDLDQRTPSAARLSGPAGVALDGTHLIVADTENHRVLIWNAVPTATGTPADLVLGQADFTGRRPNRGRGDSDGDGFSDAAGDGFFYPTGVASDGTHLFVADRLNNRVLVYSTFPTVSGAAADAVLGQADLQSSLANRGGGAFSVAPDGFDLPTGVTLAGTTLWVADTENNRVVRWDNVTTAPSPGAFVGQTTGNVVSNPNYEQPTDVNTGIVNVVSTVAGSVLRPRAAVVANGALYVSEQDSNRVHIFDAVSLAPAGELGQPSDTTSSVNASGPTATSLAVPRGIASDGTTLWVSDSGNHRVVGFSVATPPATGTAATAVVGQASFLANGFDQSSTAASGVTSQPSGVALGNGNLYVADTGNSRVLVLKTPVQASQIPIRVYGQPDMLQALANSGGAPSAQTLNAPRGIFVDPSHLIVADTGNHRVLIFDPNSSAPGAQIVLGQSSFTGGTPNAGGASASTMQSPVGVFSDGTSLWVADAGNHRVLVWNAFPTQSGQPADRVLGQTSFSGTLPNQGGATATAASLLFPSSVDVVGGVLYIADSGNNRVVGFSTAPSASGAAADRVLGQADLTSRGPAVAVSDLVHMAGPVALADDGDNLYVTDRDLARVLVFSVGSLSNGGSASSLIGYLGGLVLKTPAAVAAERTPFFTSRLYIADTGDNQVAVVQSVGRLTL